MGIDGQNSAVTMWQHHTTWDNLHVDGVADVCRTLNYVKKRTYHMQKQRLITLGAAMLHQDGQDLCRQQQQKLCKQLRAMMTMAMMMICHRVHSKM